MLIVYGKWFFSIHIIAGTVAFGLIIGRVVWGFVGTRYVRFGSFLKGVEDVKNEFSIFKNGEATHSVGHPALAGWVMLLLMFCAFGAGTSGIWLHIARADEIKEWVFKIHEIFANSLLIIAFIHIQGVVLHTLTHKDGIVSGMVDGKRPALEHEQIGRLTKIQIAAAFAWLMLSLASLLWAYSTLIRD